MTILPDTPYFIPRFTIQTGGVDFLGMRQANLDLREKCLPGFSNSTDLLRPFSVMCWIYWKLNQVARTAGVTSITNSQARAFREKVEVLFTWGHRLKGFDGLPGISFGPPSARNGQVSLEFEDWHRIPNSTGLMAAVNYGPALKTTIGLGFLSPIESEVFQPVGYGVALAEAMDQGMRENGIPPVLESLGTSVGTENDALKAFLSWNVGEPSAGEKSAFRYALYAPSQIDSATSIGLRSATLRLVIEVLENAAKPLTVDEIRESLFWGLSALPSVSMIPAIGAACRRWIVLQVRQAQRLAMEALLSWIEKRIIYDGDSDTRALAVAGARACEGDSHLTEGDVTECVKRQLGNSIQSLSQATQAGAANEEVSIFYLMKIVQEQIRNETDEMVPSALRLLSLCREYTVLMEEVSDLRSSLRYGGVEGLSLASWRETCDRTADLNVEGFLLLVFEELVLSQHLAVATRRYDGGVVRLRVTIEEDGLRALVLSPWKPAPAADKLASGLSLMVDCGLVLKATPGRFAAA